MQAPSAAAAAAHPGRPLFRGALVTITDVACRTHDGACGLEQSVGDRLVFTRSGAAVARRADARQLALVSDPGQAVLLDAACAYRVRHPSSEPHACTIFAFASSVIADGAPPPGLASAQLLLRYHRLRGALLTRAAWSASSPLAVEEEAIALLSGATTAPADACRVVRARRHRELAESAKLLLASAPASRHNLAAVADAFGVSPSHLAHVFRAVVGVPMHQYLLHVRMALALDRLSGGATDLSRLALDLGFATHSHFSAAFRHHFGVPPRVVRRALGISHRHRSSDRSR